MGMRTRMGVQRRAWATQWPVVQGQQQHSTTMSSPRSFVLLLLLALAALSWTSILEPLPVSAQTPIKNITFCSPSETQAIEVPLNAVLQVTSHPLFGQSSYENNMRCFIELLLPEDRSMSGYITIDVVALGIEFFYDQFLITLPGGRFINVISEGPAYLPVDYAPSLSFITDGSVVNSGFLLSITFREETFPEDDIAVCPTIPMAVALPAGTDEATIVSHPLFGISNYYSNENCNLTIPVEDNHVGVLLVTTLNVEIGYDFLYFASGSRAEAIMGMIVYAGQIGERIFVTFTSDESIAQPGFQLLFSHVDVSNGPFESPAVMTAGPPRIVISEDTPVGSVIYSFSVAQEANFTYTFTYVLESYADLFTTEYADDGLSARLILTSPLPFEVDNIEGNLKVEDPRSFCITGVDGPDVVINRGPCSTEIHLEIYVPRIRSCPREVFIPLRGSITASFSEIPREIAVTSSDAYNISQSIPFGTNLALGNYPFNFTFEPIYIGESPQCVTNLAIVSGEAFLRNSGDLVDVLSPYTAATLLFDYSRYLPTDSLSEFVVLGNNVVFQMYGPPGTAFFITPAVVSPDDRPEGSMSSYYPIFISTEMRLCLSLENLSPSTIAALSASNGTVSVIEGMELLFSTPKGLIYVPAPPALEGSFSFEDERFCAHFQADSEPLSEAYFSGQFGEPDTLVTTAIILRAVLNPVFQPSGPAFFAIDNFIIGLRTEEFDNADLLSNSIIQQLPLVSIGDFEPPEIEGCPANDIYIEVLGTVVQQSVMLPILSVSDNIDVSSFMGESGTTISITLSQTPYQVTFTASDGMNTATCSYRVFFQLPNFPPFLNYFPMAVRRNSVRIGTTRQVRFVYNLLPESKVMIPEFNLAQTHQIQIILLADPLHLLHIRNLDRVSRFHWVVEMDLNPTGANTDLLKVAVPTQLTKASLVLTDRDGNVQTLYADEGAVVMSQREGSYSGRITIQFASPTQTPGVYSSVALQLQYAHVTNLNYPLSLIMDSHSVIGIVLEVDEREMGDLAIIREDFVAFEDNVAPFFTNCPQNRTVTVADRNNTTPAPFSPADVETYTRLIRWGRILASDESTEVTLVSQTYTVGDREAVFNISAPDSVGDELTTTAYDRFGNSDTCTFFVRVTDNIPPYVACNVAEDGSIGGSRPLRIELDSESSAVIEPTTWPAMATDNSQLFAPPVLVSPRRAMTVRTGLFSTTVTYRDWYGLESSCVASIEVVDIRNPIIQCPLSLSETTSSAAATFNFTIDAGDNTGVQRVEVSIPGQTDPVQLESTRMRGGDTDPPPEATTTQAATTMIPTSSAPSTTSPSSSGGPKLDQYVGRVTLPVGDTALTVTAFDRSGNTAVCSIAATIVQVAGSSSSSGTPTSVVAGATAAGLILLLIIIVLAVLVHRKEKQKPQNWDDILATMERFHMGDGGVREPREIKREHLQLISELGNGAFGVVYKGKLTEIAHTPGYLVAVKSLHENAAAADKTDLLAEAIVMAQFDHPNVAGLIGAITIGTPVFVILEYAENGSLKSLLERTPDISNVLRLRLILGSAKGLEHIHSKGFIHRDIASRNILVSSDFDAKVADFGLTRETASRDSASNYYRSHGGQLPIRWTAPEVLTARQPKFDQTTDVWSFGVMMYEVYTEGRTPYDDFSNEQVWIKVTGGYRLPKPECCPQEVYDNMMHCWNENALLRPKFSELVESFNLKFDFEARTQGILLNPSGRSTPVNSREQCSFPWSRETAAMSATPPTPKREVNSMPVPSQREPAAKMQTLGSPVVKSRKLSCPDELELKKARAAINQANKEQNGYIDFINSSLRRAPPVVNKDEITSIEKLETPLQHGDASSSSSSSSSSHNRVVPPPEETPTVLVQSTDGTVTTKVDHHANKAGKSDPIKAALKKLDALSEKDEDYDPSSDAQTSSTGACKLAETKLGSATNGKPTASNAYVDFETLASKAGKADASNEEEERAKNGSPARAESTNRHDHDGVENETEPTTSSREELAGNGTESLKAHIAIPLKGGDGTSDDDGPSTESHGNNELPSQAGVETVMMTPLGSNGVTKYLTHDDEEVMVFEC